MEEKEVCSWYIVYTPYSLTKVKNLLDIAKIKYYCPIRTVVRKWKGVSTKSIQIPIVPSCLFICIQFSDIIIVQMMKEISFLVNKEGKRIQYSKDQMIEIKRLSEEGKEVDLLLNMLHFKE